MRQRFAPSPTGLLHIGHAFSAVTAWRAAQAANGEFLLRIEDIDQTRARPEWEDLIYDDLRWLGLSWDGPVMRQSDRLPAYRAALTALWNSETVFACTCNRRDILAAASAPNEGEPVTGPDGIVYPGTCRANRSGHGRRPIPQDAALRLDMDAAIRAVSDPGAGDNAISFRETGQGPTGETGVIDAATGHMTGEIGDVVLARRDMGTSYHLSVVIDDAAQGITHVTRGEDLFEATRIHVALQRLLGLPTPVYHHHRLIRDDRGKRLAKRDDARAIRKYREDGASPADIRRLVGLD